MAKRLHTHHHHHHHRFNVHFPLKWAGWTVSYFWLPKNRVWSYVFTGRMPLLYQGILFRWKTKHRMQFNVIPRTRSNHAISTSWSQNTDQNWAKFPKIFTPTQISSNLIYVRLRIKSRHKMWIQFVCAAHTHVRVSTYTQKSTYIRMRIHMCTHMYKSAHICTCLVACVHKCVHICVRTHTHVYLRTQHILQWLYIYMSNANKSFMIQQ